MHPFLCNVLGMRCWDVCFSVKCNSQVYLSSQTSKCHPCNMYDVYLFDMLLTFSFCWPRYKTTCLFDHENFLEKMTYYLEINNSLSWKVLNLGEKSGILVNFFFTPKEAMSGVVITQRNWETCGIFQNRWFCFIFSIWCYSCFLIILELS